MRKQKRVERRQDSSEIRLNDRYKERPSCFKARNCPRSVDFFPNSSMEDGVKGTKKRDDHAVDAKLRMWTEPRMGYRERTAPAESLISLS